VIQRQVLQPANVAEGARPQNKNKNARNIRLLTKRVEELERKIQHMCDVDDAKYAVRTLTCLVCNSVMRPAAFFTCCGHLLCCWPCVVQHYKLDSTDVEEAPQLIVFPTENKPMAVCLNGACAASKFEVYKVIDK
jgi:hypothetical protein